MREWRKTHRLTEEQRLKDIARSYANVYKRRGLLFQEDCRVCGSPDSQMHHADYALVEPEDKRVPVVLEPDWPMIRKKNKPSTP